jgi:hypothetical protein
LKQAFPEALRENAVIAEDRRKFWLIFLALATLLLVLFSQPKPGPDAAPWSSLRLNLAGSCQAVHRGQPALCSGDGAVPCAVEIHVCERAYGR